MKKVNRITRSGNRITKTQVDTPKPVYNVRIDQKVYEPLAMLAAKDGRSITNYINRVLEQHLDT